MRAPSFLVLGWLVLQAACGSSSSTTADGGATRSDAPKGVAPSGDSSSAAGDARHEPPPAVDATVPADAQLLSDASLPRTFTVTNRCADTVWAAALPKTTFPDDGIVEMAPGTSFKVGVDNGWSGRIWGKTGCETTNGSVTCASDSFPASLAELTLTKTPATGLDFYDVSLVDGFNLPIDLIAVGHTPDAAHPYSCGDPSCTVNLNTTCPTVLQDKVDGGVIACANDECKVVGNNDAASPACTYPNQYTEFFKDACPTAYSFPYDDPTSTFTCKGQNDYAVIFCP